MSNNLGYILAVEKLLAYRGVPSAPRRSGSFMAELTRLQSHLVWLACHALDIGAMTVFIYAFRERETIMELLRE